MCYIVLRAWVVPVKFSKMVHLRATEGQYQAWALRAGADKRSISDWIRYKLDEIVGASPQPVMMPEPEANPNPVVVEEAPESNHEESAPEPEPPSDDSVPSVLEPIPSLGGASSEEPDWATILGNVVDT